MKLKKLSKKKMKTQFYLIEKRKKEMGLKWLKIGCALDQNNKMNASTRPTCRDVREKCSLIFKIA